MNNILFTFLIIILIIFLNKLSIKNQILVSSMEHVYGALGIENHDKNSMASLRFWFDHLRKNYNLLELNELITLHLYQD